MDWTTIIVAAVSALISGGGIAGIVFFRENKRAKQLQNEATASSQWRELYEKSEAKVESQSVKIDALYKENNRLRDENNSLTTQAAVMTMYKCEKLVCADRMPPFGSQFNKIQQ